MADSGTIEDKKKAHRDRNSGRKATKKKAKKDADNPIVELTDKQRNPKAFAFNSAIRAERRFRRKEDIDTKKQHIPIVDRQAIEPPPILIAVVGPPKVGKTTVINNLIRLFTRSPLTDIKGPVTIVTGKKRRITLIECNNDINSMIDLAKVADLVLLLIDASFGFEMEIFEFLNICQVHGMPRIMGILTHLDMIKNQTALKTKKKTLKHRFWTEVYPGAKLFYLSGIIHGEYLRNEIKNLGRFISVMKFRPLTWRTTHSYLLGDRYEDLTNQELVRKNPKCDRSISIYGYVRGVPLNKNTMVHIAGFGDLRIHDISFLPDPCPLPEQMKKRALIEKERLVYAPFSGVGGIVYDKDAVYVELGGSHSHHQRANEDESTNLMTNLIDAKETLDVKMEHSKMKIFTEGQEITADDVGRDSDSEVDEGEHEEDSEEEDEEDNQPKGKSTELYAKPLEKEIDELDKELEELRKEHKEKIITDESGRTRRQVVFDVSDDQIADEMSENDDSDDDNEDEEDSDQNDIDISDNEQGEVQNKKKRKKGRIPTTPYISLKSNKDKAVYTKVNEVLKQLDEKKFAQPVWSDEVDDDDEEDSNTSEEEEQQQNSSGNTSLGETEDEDIPTTKNNTIEENTNSSDASDSDDEMNNPDLKWKDNLAQKAEEAFFERQKSSKNLMKLVYGVFDAKHLTKLDNENQSDDDEEEIGGLFKIASKEQEKRKIEKDQMDLEESTLHMPWNANIRNWLEHENKMNIQNCFVTGKWKESEDASELLRIDDASDLSEVDECFGDFEDLETGEKFTSKSAKSDKSEKDSTEKRKRDVSEKDQQADREILAEKKRKLKEKFDADYDNTEKASFYDDLKMTAEKQAQLNKSVFENMPDDLRVQIEGYRAGMYVRFEFQNVPCEFISNFNPTYPIVLGALNMGEENIGFVNVKIKKHRWYKKILKANDPLIISLGWRRFQTVPLYSKLEDDLKCRYLKYTPEHLTCNAHFWGPITPQGTGFLALQACNHDAEALKRLGFRIAATGAVQELDKSTQIMKKLKLIGYPLKIYKKTAFVKGMFNSALEVAKFEGARIKTVSGIRGQIKKAASKPEGVFRATFEDKIQLSDIIFCRTWYKVDVQKFYTPITTLLLPEDEKNTWRGLRTTGEIKRERGIRSEVNNDHLYTDIKRDPKVFKPLIIPAKLQEALPYRDKPKHEARAKDKTNKKPIERVAVIREPKEQKVANMMKMIKTAYDHKQDVLKRQTKERVEKHRQQIEAIEMKKGKKLKDVKKNVFRQRSKAAIAAEKKGKKGGGKSARDEFD